MPLRNYPLTTPEGELIPIDILEPVSMLGPIAIDDNAMGAAIVIPDFALRFLEIWATADCNIGFNVTPVNGVTELGVMHLIADEPRLVLPIGGYISAITDEGSGVLKVNILNRWESMKKDYQTEVGE